MVVRNSVVDADVTNLVIADGFVLNSASNISNLLDDVFVGNPASDSLGVVVAKEGREIGIIEEFVSKEGSSGRYYWANSVSEVVVGERAKFKKERKGLKSCHFQIRVLVVVEEGGEIGIIEEFVSKEGSSNRYYWANSVLEVVVGEREKVKYSCIQNQSLRSTHMELTWVLQAF
ncbi:hypothetical protein K2173_016903 [Erythroxylum novogranatense]|uniref:SUF system FeS cluster assembly SufBD core domain-containing protein n=1 Tax=Erythroxylum novogranatense TaxID=1862640 RepID=A0AAV8U554_9ROSI|nr:hypothetical protein K2173_016903 [Erythroxylum novogranatense]